MAFDLNWPLTSQPTNYVQANQPSYNPDLSNTSISQNLQPTNYDQLAHWHTLNYAGQNPNIVPVPEQTGIPSTPKGNDLANNSMLSWNILAPGATPSFFDKLMGYSQNGKNYSGFGGTALKLGTGAFNAYTGWNAMNTAKDNLKFQKNAFSKQFEAQRNLTNSQLEDRQKQRIAENPMNNLSVNAYMKKYGV